MSNKETDISLIRKYLNGELNARAMHQLEKRAQADPFLMDALEGYEKAGKDHGNQLTEISERLHQRIEQKERRIIPWKTLSIAASILIVATIGGLILFNRTPALKPKIAQAFIAPKAEEIAKPDTNIVANEKALAPEPQPAMAKQAAHIEKSRTVKSSANGPITSASEIASADVSKVSKIDKDTGASLSEAIVMGYTTQRKKGTTAAVATVSSGYLGKSSADSPVTSLQGRVAGVNIVSGDNSLMKINRSFSKDRINGRVIAKDDGQPLVGVTVKVKGTNTATVTDMNGKFTLHADSGKNSTLVIAYIGYITNEVMAHASDSLRSIALAPNNQSLSEVVVTGYNSNRGDATDDSPIIDAHPINGWSSLKKYLDENAVSPDGKKGIVKLSLTVDRNGNISNVKVLKSLSTETDAKAIDLINNGPGWAGSTSKRTETITVRVKFTK